MTYVGYDNSLRDTPFRNNLTETLIAYLEWQRTGNLCNTSRNNFDTTEILECPQQYWLVPGNKLSEERYDSFFYCPDLHNMYKQIQEAKDNGEIDIMEGSSLNRRQKLTHTQKTKLKESDEDFKYIEFGDVTKYGLITKYIQGKFIDIFQISARSQNTDLHHKCHRRLQPSASQSYPKQRRYIL